MTCLKTELSLLIVSNQFFLWINLFLNILLYSNISADVYKYFLTNVLVAHDSFPYNSIGSI